MTKCTIFILQKVREGCFFVVVRPPLNVHSFQIPSFNSVLSPWHNIVYDISLPCKYVNNSVCQLSRNQRFTASFHHAVETLVNMLMPHITQKYKDNLDAARNANHSLAVFIKVLNAGWPSSLQRICSVSEVLEIRVSDEIFFYTFY